MLPFQDRYSRQRKLLEVGKRGQARIEALGVVLRGGPEATFAKVYLERAGVSEIELEAGTPEEWPHGVHFEHGGPSKVARGAWTALHPELKFLQ